MAFSPVLRVTLPVLVSIALTACGGGGFSGGSGGESGSGGGGGGEGGGETATPTSLKLSASSRELTSHGSEPITISAFTKDANNTVLSDIPISFSVNSDANLSTATGSSIVTALLTPGTPGNRQLTVTASVSGLPDETITVDVIGTTLSLDGPDRVSINDANTYTLKLQDSAAQRLGYTELDLPTITGNCSIAASQTNGVYQTNSSGVLELTVTGTADGDCKISANALGATAEKTLTVSGDEFKINSTTPKNAEGLTEVSIGTPETITLVLKKNNLPQAGKMISLSTTRGTISPSSTVTTNAAGEASFQIESASAGDAVITAITSDGLTATLDSFEFVAVNPVNMTTQAVPSLIAPTGHSEIVAIIRDASDNPVKNKIINFNIQSDSTAGELSTASAKTDSFGRASVTYTAGNASSAHDGVVIKSSILNSTLEQNTNLTVGGNALRLVIGQDNLLVSNEIYYQKTFGVIVTDSSGHPVANQQVNFSLIPETYRKGRMIPVTGESEGTTSGWVMGAYVDCPSEDLNNNGLLDAGEDLNNSGELEPTHDATVTGNAVTGADGKVIVTVVYPKSSARWSQQRIIANVNVQGTEYQEQVSFRLPILADDVDDVNIVAPNELSPYGQELSCFNPN
jgi:hypothetical protein